VLTSDSVCRSPSELSRGHGSFLSSSVQNSRPHKRSMAGSRVYVTEEFAQLGAA
jgi:hypothetical protein